jgi:hypothetical protein
MLQGYPQAALWTAGLVKDCCRWTDAWNENFADCVMK